MTEPGGQASPPGAAAPDIDAITVEVVCATPARQELVALQLPPGTTARQALERAEFDALFPELDLARAPLAVYGTAVSDDYRLSAGDRVEVLRPLRREPRDARRELAARGETMVSRPPRQTDRSAGFDLHVAANLGDAVVAEQHD